MPAARAAPHPLAPRRLRLHCFRLGIKHVYRYLSIECRHAHGMCIDKYVGMRVGMCIDAFIDLCIDMCIDSCIGMRMGMYSGMCIGMRIDLC